MVDPTADQVIAALDLAPHPEGGFYRETFRDDLVLGQDGRAASTAIYFLLRRGEASRWHRVDAAEVWHWYGGSRLELAIKDRDRALMTVTLGTNLTAGERPQAIVPAGAWQQSRSLGDYSLVGCTVAPGFTFAGFEMAEAGFSP